MPIKKYFANADNVITNTYSGTSSDLRNTGSNAGAADIIEVYSLYDRRGQEGQELTRALIQISNIRDYSRQSIGRNTCIRQCNLQVKTLQC